MNGSSSSLEEEAIDARVAKTLEDWEKKSMPNTYDVTDVATASPVREREADPYATHEDFRTIFNDGVRELYQLALLLTREPEKAGQILVNGLEDCVTGNRVFRDWARSWAKRTIIQNAIRELKPRPSQGNSSWSGAIFPDIEQQGRNPEAHFKRGAVLRLEDFERFVFTMPVLEHYSEHDCSLLLGCSVREIREGRARALKELTDLSGRDLLQTRPFYRRQGEMTHFAHSVAPSRIFIT